MSRVEGSTDDHTCECQRSYVEYSFCLQKNNKNNNVRTGISICHRQFCMSLLRTNHFRCSVLSDMQMTNTGDKERKRRKKDICKSPAPWDRVTEENSATIEHAYRSAAREVSASERKHDENDDERCKTGHVVR